MKKNVDQIYLALASGKPVLQKTLNQLTSLFVIGSFTFPYQINENERVVEWSKALLGEEFFATKSNPNERKIIRKSWY